MWDNFNSIFKFGVIEVNRLHLARGFFSDEVKILKLTKAPMNLLFKNFIRLTSLTTLDIAITENNWSEFLVSIKAISSAEFKSLAITVDLARN